MIEYKNAAFYTEFFRSIDGFSLIEEFGTSTDKRDEDLYIGCIEVLDTVHPLIVRVEIPFTFPHNKLVFRTDSISGYPHLIHSDKIHIGDWFCLNTPFAETAEEQLKTIPCQRYSRTRLCGRLEPCLSEIFKSNEERSDG